MAEPNGLRELRRERGFSLEAAEFVSGVDKSTWSRAERGTITPTPETLVKMSRVLGVSIARLRRILDGGVVDARRS